MDFDFVDFVGAPVGDDEWVMDHEGSQEMRTGRIPFKW